jgi:hypothetical protein
MVLTLRLHRATPIRTRNAFHLWTTVSTLDRLIACSFTSLCYQVLNDLFNTYLLTFFCMVFDCCFLLLGRNVTWLRLKLQTRPKEASTWEVGNLTGVGLMHGILLIVFSVSLKKHHCHFSSQNFKRKISINWTYGMPDPPIWAHWRTSALLAEADQWEKKSFLRSELSLRLIV